MTMQSGVKEVDSGATEVRMEPAVRASLKPGPFQLTGWKVLGLALVAVLLAFVATSAMAQTEPPTGDLVCKGWVVGQVTDDSTEEPVAAAELLAVPAGAGGGAPIQGFFNDQTDQEGNYNLSLANGKWLMSVTHQEYEPHQFPVTVNCGQEQEQNVTLSPPADDPGTDEIIVNVLETVKLIDDDWEGAAVEGATVTLTEDCNGGPTLPLLRPPSESKDTDDNGEARFKNLDEDQTYCIRISEASGYELTEDDEEDREIGSPRPDSFEETYILNKTLNAYDDSDNKNGVRDNVQGRTGIPWSDLPPVSVQAHHPVYCPEGVSSIPGWFDCQTTVIDSGGNRGRIELELPHDETDYVFRVAQDHDYFFPDIKEINVDGDDYGPSWTLTRQFGGLQGLITNEGEGDPVPGAKVCVTVGSTSYLACDETDTNGVYSHVLNWHSDYQIAVHHDDYFTETSSGIQVTLDQTTTQNMDLVPIPIVGDGAVTGTVCDEFVGTDWSLSGDPCLVPSLTDMPTVELLDGQVSVHSVNADVNGFFSIEGVNPGDYTLKVNHLSYESFSLPLTVPSEGLDVGKIPLTRNTQELTITVQDDPDFSSNGVEGAEITLQEKAGFVEEPISEISDSQGQMKFDLKWATDAYTFDFPTSMIEEVVYEADSYELTVDGDDPLQTSDTIQLSSPIEDLTGTVTDIVSGDPVDSVSLVAAGPETLSDRYVLSGTTNAGGEYLLQLPAVLETNEDGFTVTFTHDSYQDYVEDEVAPSTSNLDVDLDRVERSITGVVHGEQENGDSFPLADVTIDVVDESSTMSEDDGDFRINSIPWGDYTLQFSHGLYDTKNVDVTVMPDQGLNLDIVKLTRAQVMVTGTLSEDIGPLEEGNGIPNLDFTARCEINEGTQSTYEREVTTDDAGVFEFFLPRMNEVPGEPLPETEEPTPGMEEPAFLCDLDPGPDEFHPLEGAPIQSTDSGEATVRNFALERQAWTINGQVVDATDGSPVSDAPVCATTVSSEGEESHPCINSGSEGEFSFSFDYFKEEGVRINEVILTTTPAEHLPGGNATMIGPDSGETSPVEVQIQVVPVSPEMRTSSIQGTVTDDNATEGEDNPLRIVRGAIVTATSDACPAAEPGVSTVTDAFGQFVLILPCEGEYDLTATHPFYFNADVESVITRNPEIETFTTELIENAAEETLEGEEISMARLTNGASIYVQKFMPEPSPVTDALVTITGQDVNHEDVESSAIAGSDVPRGFAEFQKTPWGTYDVHAEGPLGNPGEGESTLIVYPLPMDERELYSRSRVIIEEDE